LASSTQDPHFSPNTDGFVASPVQEQHSTDGTEMLQPGDIQRRPSDILRSLADFENQETVDLQQGEEFWEGDEEENENRFINYFLLSHIAMQLRDKIPRGTHVKGSIPYSRAFTGKDIVVSNTGIGY
jgi:hypothetical protein